ncbi:hypothetical protein Lfu02_09630 [Longispora fulva]|uniref:Ig-like domain-containing protein n=1 Tax=Longispora fulva TaxID=619741 RepID=A0A8J7GB52_9ACTN|nr:hypothetical protein [Longispora fulva]MBG6135174.1 hypothetical protein [Longispora fulva]GIG56591.1 hypothetical protein Lfu02_09630 [Longispora fulva]
MTAPRGARLLTTLALAATALAGLTAPAQAAGTTSSAVRTCWVSYETSGNNGGTLTVSGYYRCSDYDDGDLYYHWQRQNADGTWSTVGSGWEATYQCVGTTPNTYRYSRKVPPGYLTTYGSATVYNCG